MKVVGLIAALGGSYAFFGVLMCAIYCSCKAQNKDEFSQMFKERLNDSMLTSVATGIATLIQNVASALFIQSIFNCFFRPRHH